MLWLPPLVFLVWPTSSTRPQPLGTCTKRHTKNSRALFSSQLGTADGADCENHFKHGCLGHACTTYGGSSINSHARRLASQLPVSTDGTTSLDGLHALVAAVLQRAASGPPPPEVVIVGDCLSSEFWAAPVMGLPLLGYSLANETAFWCNVKALGHALYLESETFVSNMTCKGDETALAVFAHGFTVRYVELRFIKNNMEFWSYSRTLQSASQTTVSTPKARSTTKAPLNL